MILSNYIYYHPWERHQNNGEHAYSKEDEVPSTAVHDAHQPPETKIYLTGPETPDIQLQFPIPPKPHSILPSELQEIS